MCPRLLSGKFLQARALGQQAFSEVYGLVILFRPGCSPENVFCVYRGAFGFGLVIGWGKVPFWHRLYKGLVFERHGFGAYVLHAVVG